MTHLGSQLSALADGQLSATAAERALEHVAACAACADELAAARAARRALASAFDVPVTPELTQRLLALGATSGVARASTQPTPIDATFFAQGSVPLPGARRRRAAPSDSLHGDVTSRWSSAARWVAAAGTAAAAVTAGLFVMGDLPAVVPELQTAGALTVLGRAAPGPGQAVPEVLASGAAETAGTRAAVQTAGLGWGAAAASAAGEATGTGTQPSRAAAGSPVTAEEVDAWLVAHGWKPCGELPAGYRVSALRAPAGTDGGVELDLTGPQGVIVVTQHYGRLDASVPAAAGATQLGPAQVHLLSRAPWHAVWQSGDIVVSVLAQHPSREAADIGQAFPPSAADDSVSARIARGWAAVAGAWRP